MQAIKRFLQFHFENPNYRYFLLSLVLMLVIPSLSEITYYGQILMKLSYGFVILMATIYTAKSYTDTAILGTFGFLAFLTFHLYSSFNIVSIFNPLFTLVFFGFVFVRLMQYVFAPKAITFNDVFALSAGYLIIGVIAAPFFYLLDMEFQNAFNIKPQFYDLLYFSYITLTGVGYGDIVPIHPVARSITLLLGIMGQLYLVILVGLILGRYLATTGYNKDS